METQVGDRAVVLFPVASILRFGSAQNANQNEKNA